MDGSIAGNGVMDKNGTKAASKLLDKDHRVPCQIHIALRYTLHALDYPVNYLLKLEPYSICQ